MDVREQLSIAEPRHIESAITSNRLQHAADDLQQLRATRGTPTEGAPALRLAAKGRPMARFPPASSSWPFANNTAARVNLNGGREQTDREELFSKVQQLPWEAKIVWGIDFAPEENFIPSVDTEPDVETERVDSLSSTDGPHARGIGCGGGAVQRRKVSVGAREHVFHALSSSRFTTVSSSGHSTTDSNYADTGSEIVTNPTFDQATRPASLSTPRKYLWEIEDEGDMKLLSAAKTPASFRKRNIAQIESSRLPYPLNRDLQNDSWIDAIGWNSPQSMPESKLVLDDNDSMLHFAVPDQEEDRPALRIPVRKIGPAEARLELQNIQQIEKKRRIEEIIMNPHLDEEKHKRRLVENAERVHHSLPAFKLAHAKSELPRTKLRSFHRPRGKFRINERLQFVPLPNVSLTQDEASAAIAPILKSTDLYPSAGGKLILVEYAEQNPPVLSNPGMATRIMHYWRRPGNAGDSGICTKPAPPDAKMGEVITLDKQDDSPFVGDVPPGRFVTSLNSGMSKVPIFPHTAVAPFAAKLEHRKSGKYDLFLLCRSVPKKQGDTGGDEGQVKSTMHILELPQVFVAGQVEPQIEVPTPNSRKANEFIRPYMSLHILRLFKKAKDGDQLKFEEVARAFSSQSGTAIRKRMKETATFERGVDDSGWWKKNPASELKSEEELREDLSPEAVCLYESMMAGGRRLKDVGLTKLTTPEGVGDAINQLLKRLELRKQSLSMKAIEPLNLNRREKERAEQGFWKTDPIVRKLETDIQVARYIDEQLQLTPWNLTTNYVECHLQSKGSGMLKLSGVGDPSGRGEGFSFVRVPQSRATKKEGEEDAGAVAVTGTSADLRKLKMAEAGVVLRNLGVAEVDIKKLRRWDRIHLIRELSNQAAVHGAGVLAKFVRGGRKSLSAQQMEYRKRCDMIYETQMNVLSSTTMDFSSSEDDSDGNEDLDEWEKDVEAGMTVGKGADKLAKRDLKNFFSMDGRTLNRSKEVLAEREDALELAFLVEDMNEDSGPTYAAARHPEPVAGQMHNEEGAASQRQSTIPPAVETPTIPASSPPSLGNAILEPSHAMESIPRRTVLKRTTRMIEEDGTEMVKIEFILDGQQISRFKAMQKSKERQANEERAKVLRKRKHLLTSKEDFGSQRAGDNTKKRRK